MPATAGAAQRMRHQPRQPSRAESSTARPGAPHAGPGPAPAAPPLLWQGGTEVATWGGLCSCPQSFMPAGAKHCTHLCKPRWHAGLTFAALRQHINRWAHTRREDSWVRDDPTRAWLPQLGRAIPDPTTAAQPMQAGCHGPPHIHQWFKPQPAGCRSKNSRAQPQLGATQQAACHMVPHQWQYGQP